MENSVTNAHKSTAENVESVLSDSIEQGKVIIIEDVDCNFPSYLNSVLDKKLIHRNNKDYIMFNDNEIVFSNNFRLILLSKLSNPIFPVKTFD